MTTNFRPVVDALTEGFEAGGFADGASRFTYAVGQLVLWSANPALDLSDPAAALRKARHVAIANPDIAPYGRSAVQSIAFMWLSDISDRLVTAENIGQAYALVASGAAELGFVAGSAVTGGAGKNGAGKGWTVPADHHDPIRQDAILLTHGEGNPAATACLDYLRSDAAAAVIARVALARALLTAPRLILMDEPLSALDHVRRQEILPYIEELRDEARVPILYVSHVHSEVARLAGHMLTLAGGRVTGFGPTQDILSNPALASGLAGEEPGSLIAATVTGMTGDGLCALAFPGGTILTPERLGAAGARVRLFVRARDVMLSRGRPEGVSALNILPAVVRSVADAGPASNDIALDCGGTTLRAQITRRSTASLGLAPGVACHAILKTVALARD